MKLVTLDDRKDDPSDDPQLCQDITDCHLPLLPHQASFIRIIFISPEGGGPIIIISTLEEGNEEGGLSRFLPREINLNQLPRRLPPPTPATGFTRGATTVFTSLNISRPSEGLVLMMIQSGGEEGRENITIERKWSAFGL